MSGALSGGTPLDADGKIAVIQAYAYASGFRTFVETGTASGYTLAAMVPWFDRLYSIELSQDFYLQAVRKFIDIQKVTCLWGPSETVLWHVMEMVTQPAVIWLDAHYVGSGARSAQDTPIREELGEILHRPAAHVILIDDARLFGVDPAYPTIDWVRAFVARHGPKYASFNVADDIIRIAPAGL